MVCVLCIVCVLCTSLSLRIHGNFEIVRFLSKNISCTAGKVCKAKSLRTINFLPSGDICKYICELFSVPMLTNRNARVSVQLIYVIPQNLHKFKPADTVKPAVMVYCMA